MIIEQTDKKLENRLLVLEKFIGNTPLIPLNNIFVKEGVKIFAKKEWQQFGGSVKSRPAFRIVHQAVKRGNLGNGQHLLDASSGNTAIAYAAIGAALHIPVTICLPENASDERKTSLKVLGASIIYTSRFGSTDEAQEKAEELYYQYPEKYFYANQYANDDNWKAHYYNTAEEVFRQTNGQVTQFVAGLGTTGTFTGTGKRLKELNPYIHLVSLQPESALHGLEGWKHLETARVPAIYDSQLADDNLTVNTDDAYKLIKSVAAKEGLLISPSSAANLAGALKIAQKIEKGVIVTVFPDNADKYTEVLQTII